MQIFLSFLSAVMLQARLPLSQYCSTNAKSAELSLIDATKIAA